MKQRNILLLLLGIFLLAGAYKSNAQQMPPDLCEITGTSVERWGTLRINGVVVQENTTGGNTDCVTYLDKRNDFTFEVEAGQQMEVHTSGPYWYSTDCQISWTAHNLGVFIDLNKDGDIQITDPNTTGAREERFYFEGLDVASETITFNLPEDIDGGLYVMRVVTSDGVGDVVRQGCGTQSFFQVVDILINVKPQEPAIVD
ncbi:MAG: GEVED domain-containing protein, partial [Candidatus Kapaibacterium sp.]